MTMQPAAARSPKSWNDDAPAIANSQRILRDDAPISTFGENVWRLNALEPPRKRRFVTCNFESIPSQFRLAVKKALWILINEGKPNHSVQRGHTRTKKWIGPDSIGSHVSCWRAFLAYVAEQTPEVRSLSGIISDTMDAYVKTLAGQIDNGSAVFHYSSIRLLHDLTANFPVSERLRAPSWVDDQVFLSQNDSSDNTRTPLPDAVLTPMLLWSVAFVEQFADDILAARDAIEAYALTPAQNSPVDDRQAEDLLRAWRKDHGDCLPWTDTAAGGIALAYMCFVLNWPIRFQRGGLANIIKRTPDLTVGRSLSCPVPTAINGRIHGKSWQPEGLDFYRLTAHQIDLQSACLFLIGLNSSMRSDELLSLEMHTHHDDGTRKPITERIEAPDGQVRYLLHGRTFKGQDRVDGTQRPDGIVRTWAITELGATAVSVLARLNGPRGRLFATIRSRVTGSSAQAVTTDRAADNLRKFVARLRVLAAQLALPAEYVFPEDAEDYMALGVLRRTSEVLTQQEIGGVLAGAHQAGHRVRDPYDTRVTEGYGGLATQSKLGRRSSEHTAQALAHLVVESHDEVIGGPAGERALDVADLAAAELELVDPANLMTPVLSKEWKRITKSIGQSVYEVPLAGEAHAYCIFYLPWSACTKEGEQPDVSGCKIVCANKALTMESIRGLRQRQQELEASKQNATSEEIIRAQHLIDAYDQQIADSGLPVAPHDSEDGTTP